MTLLFASSLDVSMTNIAVSIHRSVWTDKRAKLFLHLIVRKT